MEAYAADVAIDGLIGNLWWPWQEELPVCSVGPVDSKSCNERETMPLLSKKERKSHGMDFA